MAGDSIVDDPVNLEKFSNWMGVFAANGQSPASVNGETIDKETQPSAVEPQSEESLPNGTQLNAKPIQTQNGPEVLNGTTQKSLKVSQIQEDEDLLHDNTDGENVAQPPVVSIAHRITKAAVAPSSKLANVNKVDHSLETELLHSPAIINPIPTRSLQELDTKAMFPRYHNTLPNPFEKESLVDVKPEGTDNGPSIQHMSKISETKLEDSTKDQKAESVVPKRGNSLLDSKHAPNARKGQKLSTFRGPYHHPPDISMIPSWSSNPVQMDDGAKHDPMEYYENKRKEYYPGTPLSSNGPKVMLQSKDPNMSMKSPKKTASKLNPQAQNYLTAMPAQSSLDKESREEGVSSVLAVPKIETEPAFAAVDSKDESASTDMQQDSEAIVDEAEGSKVHQQEKTTTIAEPSPTTYQENQVVDERFDLTPVRTIIDARNPKGPEANSRQETESEEVIKTETKSPVIPTVEEDTPEIVSSRTLMIKNLPENSDYTLVQSLIRGASIMSMKLMQDKNCAQVQLTDMDDCQKIVESGKNGVRVQFNGKVYSVFMKFSTEMSDEDDDEKVELYLNCGATRVVQAEDVDLDMTMRSLYQVASGSKSSREVEGITDSFSGGVRKVVFRYTSIQDAVAFRSSLRRDAEWKTKKIEFVKDPCA